MRKSEHCSTPAEHWCKFDRINGISLGAKLIQVNDVEVRWMPWFTIQKGGGDGPTLGDTEKVFGTFFRVRSFDQVKWRRTLAPRDGGSSVFFVLVHDGA